MQNYDVLFESKNIKYIKLSYDLVNDYLLMVNDKDVSKFITLKDRTLSIIDEKNWIKEKIDNNAIIFSMIEKESNEFIGNIELLEIVDNIGELGVCITKNKQGQHYGEEAIRWFIKYCIEDLKLDDVRLSVFSHNKKAIKCYEKVGFVIYKVEKNIGKYNGEEIDDIYMRLNN